MKRVLVIGSPGAGKSTLAKRLAARTGLPLIHLDDLYWNAGWVRAERGVWLARLAEALAGERWIVDGNYNSTLERRLERADTVILLGLSRELCTARVIWRELSGAHPHMHGLKRRLPTWEFVRYTWRFPAKVPAILDTIAAHRPQRVYVLRSGHEVAESLRALG
ncbi:DNA topology modulation protein FlaR [Deinococcus piscis]|uniref:DNA topology modulation protein FlaR n=1 Tax=Deinococcus piscis TaxID=394230 RepID=A0ABQ3KCN6_9DEIO|nr:DNA topology modulation protein FlaR [Deinococcus piscis]GHG12875.1 DNA topology modulation protein FlaR [Deinococcus piscis]